MKQLLLLPFIMLMLGAGAFANSGLPDQFSTQHRNLKSFSAISLQIPAEVNLICGDFSFSISSSEEMLDKIVTEVHNGELVIRFSKNGYDQLTEPVKIEISMPRVLALEINGSGSIQSQNEISAPSLSLEINGSGNINLSALKTETLSATVNGSGTIQNLKGTTNELNLQVNGNGEINIPDLTGKTVETAITGSGKICTGATESLHAEIAGSGDVRYAGSPLKKNVEIVGTGTVTAMN